MVRPSHAPRLSRLLVGLAWLGGLIVVPAATAADKSTPVRFSTKDQVELVGNFYPSPKGKDEPTVLMLHKYGGHSHHDGWDGLAEALQEKGYSVLTFDFRGHGKSTAVERSFWKYNFNHNLVRGLINPMRPPESISFKQFSPAYIPYLLNDIAAAKQFLDERNDAGECNSHALIILGAEEGATLGAIWMGSEWYRYPAKILMQPPFAPIFQEIKTDEQMGRDQYAAIWLSMGTSLGSFQAASAVQTALGTVAKENRRPMAFIFGQKDDRAANLANRLLALLRSGDKDTQKLTNAMPIKETKLAGSALLRKELGTEQWIVDSYLPFLRERKPVPKWNRTDAERSSYVWMFPGQRVPVIAKTDLTKTLEPLPVERLLPTGQ